MNAVETNLSSAPEPTPQVETQSEPSRPKMERGGDLFPDNIEELISTYLIHQAMRLVEAGGPAELQVYVQTDFRGGYKTTALSAAGGGRLFSGETAAEAIDKHIEWLRDHDPVAEKKAEIERLQSELAELEGRTK